MKPISIVMSVYNEPLGWLKGSIESVLGQTFGDFELIIVNDNPERGDIGDLLEQHKNADGRVRIITNDENLGLTKSLNKAIKAAEGKYVARMDADDVALPERLGLQYKFLEENDDIFLAGSSVKIIGHNGAVRHSAIKHTNHKQIVEDMFHGRLALYHPTIMFRNECFLYREHFETAQDYDFYLTLLSENKKFGNLRDVLLHYRVSNRSISMSNKRKQVLSGKLALKFYYERLETGSDSYDKLDFGDETCLLRFLGMTVDELERDALRKSIVFALAAGDVEAAKQAFCNYKRYDGCKADKFMLSLFVKFPRVHGFYRKLRYGLLRF